MRNFNTVVLERLKYFTDDFATEPYEAAWASEAVFFVRALEIAGDLDDARARVQISPDGMHWCDEGTFVDLPANVSETTFGRVRHFGGWLRLAGQGAEPGGDGAHGLYPGRAYHRPALCRHSEAAPGAPAADGDGEHGDRHRAQPGRDLDR